MRWIFVRNAVNLVVNFCKKCGEKRWIIFFHRIHRNHRISYENSPHSPHFLRKFTQKPRPGILKNAISMQVSKNSGLLYRLETEQSYKYPSDNCRLTTLLRVSFVSCRFRAAPASVCTCLSRGYLIITSITSEASCSMLLSTEKSNCHPC